VVAVVIVQPAASGVLLPLPCRTCATRPHRKDQEHSEDNRNDEGAEAAETIGEEEKHMGPRSGWPLLSRVIEISWRMTIFAARYPHEGDCGTSLSARWAIRRSSPRKISAWKG
jgi:hypothetical protein